MLLAILLFALHLPAAGQKAEIDPETLQKIVERSVKIHRAWGNAQMNGAGVSAEVKEIYRHPAGGQTAVAFHVYVRGLPSEKNYTLAQMDVVTGKLTPSISGVTLGKDGLLICSGRRDDNCGDPAKLDDPIDLVLPSQKGESHHFGLISEDGASKVFFLITPFPIIGEDRGCTVEITRLLPRGAMVYVKASGFAPNETVKLESAAEIEAHDSTLQTDSNGTLESAMLPAVKGIESGKFRVIARGTATTCAPTATIDWGPASDHNE